MHRSLFFLLAGLLLVIGLAACATPYGVYADKRPIEVLKDDSMVRSRAGDALRAQGFTGVNELTVHAYFGKVFLTGEVPENQRAKAVQTAQGVRGARSVTPHWFTSLKADTEGDAAIKLRLEKNLVSSDGVTSSRIDYVVNSGRVVLLGVVESEAERAVAIKAARGTHGVRSVTSYLFMRDTASAPLQAPQTEQKPASV
ncbi:MAG: BON domain-containing protein [Deltaproteobacteria bacterium]|jgi:osmotically-inducible protein OsmY|nr:BON domain-containing protein [Deltaproteobacteria bacterium]